MMKLEGSDIGKQFYYLTVAAGTKTWPEVASFTVLEDVYTRTTWYGEGKYAQCVGVSSGGQLIMDKNVRLTFTDCYTVPRRWSQDGKWEVNLGEPSMEKVVYFQTMKLGYGDVKDNWDEAWDPWGSSLNVYWKRGCGNTGVYWYISSQRVPTRGKCSFRYLYDKTHEW